MPKPLRLKAEEAYDVPTPKAVYNWKVYAIAMMGLAAAWDYGYDLGFIGTTIVLGTFKREFGTANDPAYATEFNSNVVAIFQAGAIVGAFLTTPISAWTGRKPMNIAVAFFFIIGTILQSVAGVNGSNAAAMFLAGRFLNGVSVGGSNSIAPLYVAECSPPKIRGRLVGIYEIGVQMGTLIGFFVNYALSQHYPDNDMRWRIPVILQFVFGGLYCISSILVPESPRYLACKGYEAVLHSLGYIRSLPLDHEYLREETEDIMSQYEEELKRPGLKGFLSELSTPSIRNRFLMITWLFVTFQFTGTNAVNYYSPAILASMGYTGQSSAFLATGVYGIIRFVAVIIASLFCIDRFGRRPLLLIFGSIMAAALWIMGSLIRYGVLGPVNLVFLYIYAASFCFSYAGIPYINAEIWPQRIRVYGVAWGVGMHWIFNLAVGKSAPYMISNLPPGSAFYIFGSFLTFGAFFVYFCVPETKGVPMEQMEHIFGGRDPPSAEERHQHHQNVDVESQDGSEVKMVDRRIDASTSKV